VKKTASTSGKAKVAFPVSKRNFHRVQFKTHSLEWVLKTSGYHLFNNKGLLCAANPIDGSPVPLEEVELRIKSAGVMRAAPTPTVVEAPAQLQ
jgi:hypothetical protein